MLGLPQHRSSHCSQSAPGSPQSPREEPGAEPALKTQHLPPRSGGSSCGGCERTAGRLWVFTCRGKDALGFVPSWDSHSTPGAGATLRYCSRNLPFSPETPFASLILQHDQKQSSVRGSAP